MTDILQKFMFPDATVRGEFVELNATWRHVLAHQDYPLPVQNLLGELLSAAALLCGNLKFDGSMIMQIHGDGAIKLLVVECNDTMQMRAMAKLAEDAVISDDASLSELVNANGRGRFAITLDPNNKMPGQQAYQGIVPLEGDSIAEVIETYMKQSEQLDTKLWLACNGHVSRGLLLQRLPNHGGKLSRTEHDIHTGADDDEEETWQRASVLGTTLKHDELVSTDIETLMHRLFWEETLRIFEPLAVTFSCSCSREKVGNMLTMLGEAEVSEAVASLGKLDINCDFCGRPYSFDAVDCSQLFLPADIKVSPDPDQTH